VPAATVADAAEPRLRHSLANGVSHAHFEWRPERRGQAPSLCMVHVTFFHGRVRDQVIHHLPDRHVFAIEQRGHGRHSTSAAEA
jgi:lipase